MTARRKAAPPAPPAPEPARSREPVKPGSLVKLHNVPGYVPCYPWMAKLGPAMDAYRFRVEAIDRTTSKHYVAMRHESTGTAVLALLEDCEVTS